MLRGFPLRQTLYNNDFRQLGVSAVNQNKVNYAAVISSRVYVGTQRSENEWKENLLRDAVGWTFWFYASDMIRKLYLVQVASKAPDAFMGLLLYKKPRPENLPKTAAPLQKMARSWEQLNWDLKNPSMRWEIPSSKQIEQRSEQFVHQLQKELKGPELEKATKHVKDLMGRAKTHRNLAGFWGILISTTLLGVTIPMFNIFMTRRNNRLAELKKTKAEPPKTPAQTSPKALQQSAKPSSTQTKTNFNLSLRPMNSTQAQPSFSAQLPKQVNPATQQSAQPPFPMRLTGQPT